MAFTPAHLTKILRTTKSFDRVLNKVNVLSMKNGNAVAELKVEEEHLNPLGMLHSGMSTTLIDVISGFGLVTHEKVRGGHVTIELHLSFFHKAEVGDVVEIHSNTIKTEKDMAFMEIFVKNKKTDELLVQATHSKYLLEGLQ